MPDPADRRRVLIEADPARRPDLAGIFADLSAEMQAFMQRYDERELAAVVNFITNTIDVLKRQTARLR